MMYLVVGHRGARGRAPENTLKGFEIGCRWGDAVECDVQLSKDRHLVVMHDETVDRTTNSKGFVRDKTLAELRTLDAGQGEKIPLLSEVVEIAQKYNKKIIVEIKGETIEDAAAIGEAVEALVRQKNLSEQIILHSFWHHVLAHLKHSLPGLTTLLLFNGPHDAKDIVSLIDKYDADGISIAYEYLTFPVVTAAENEEFFVLTWVVNDKDAFAKAVESGADGIITDYPDTFSRLKAS